MIRYLRNSEIEISKWDACIENADNATVYAYSWYLNCACPGWDALVEDDYAFIMPLPHRKKSGFSYIFPPSLVQQLGIFSPYEITASKVEEFIQTIPAKFKYAEINLNHGNPADRLKIKIQQHTNLEVELNRPYFELAASYSDNLRRNLKKISGNLFSIKKTDEIQNLIDLFKNNQAKNIATLPKDFYPVLEKIAHASKTRDQMQLWQVYHEGELCAGVLFIFGCHKATFLFSASNDKGKEHNAMHFLIDRFINENSGKNLTLDFEGSDNVSLARFYRSFGATEKNYTGITVSRLPYFAINSIKTVIKIKNKLL